MRCILTKNQKQKLYNEAAAFYNLAECGRMYIPEQKNVESYIPYIVNMTFCTELLLKLLLIEEGKSIEDVEKLSHNLERLYFALRSETRELIVSSFKKPLVYNIPEELHRSKRAFVEWRYLVLDDAKGDHSVNIENDRKKEAQARKGRLQIAPFFLKELNESLLSICKR